MISNLKKLKVTYFKKTIIFSIICTLLSCFIADAKWNAAKTSNQKPKQVIIFKFDDLSDRSQLAFQRVVDTVIKKECKAGFGIVAKSCECDCEKGSYFNRVRSFVNTGRIEIWGHGYDHFMSGDTVTEFRRMPYQHQLDHFKRSLDLVYQKCGVTIRTFGTPGNRNDANTILVMNQFPQIEVFLFPFYSDSTNKQFLLTSRVDMEKGTGKMNYDFFVTNYNSRAERPYMILQGHPGIWTEEGFEIFSRIIDFLKSKDVEFMTAYEYYKFLKP